MSEASDSQSVPTRDKRPYLEVQYHPADIRRGVRYFFLSRRRVALWCVGAAVWTLFVVYGLIIIPKVISDVLAAHEYEKLTAERTKTGQHLQDLVEELDHLTKETEQVEIEMAKIYLTYGFRDQGEARGKGGYPTDPAEVPRSIYAATIRLGNGMQARISEKMAVLGVFLDEVQSFETANTDQVRLTPSISPVAEGEFVLTSPFGTRRSPFTQEIDFHPGIDLAATTGTEIYAPSDGVVTFAGRYSQKRNISWWRYGNLVTLRHGEHLMSFFAHCEDVLVKTGEKVTRGQVIATVGDTGWSTSPHLHYEIRRLDEEKQTWHPVDPRIYILDYRWRDEERLLIQARKAPDAQDYEPLPPLFKR